MQKNQNAFSLIECMIALSLGMLLCVGIFSLFNAIKTLHRRQVLIATAQNQMRFINSFLSEKIHMAGNFSCISTNEEPQLPIVQSFDAITAKRVLSLTIKPETVLLQLRECIRFHDRFQYLPVAFFIADTHRITRSKKTINALFIKIGDHPREELITGMVNFQVHLYSAFQHTENIQAIEIDYLLSSIDDVLTHPQSYWFNGNTVIASDRALYQSGILYAVVQKYL